MKSPTQKPTHNNAASASREAALYGATVAFARNPTGTTPNATRNLPVSAPVPLPIGRTSITNDPPSLRAPARSQGLVPPFTKPSRSISPSPIVANHAAATSQSTSTSLSNSPGPQRPIIARISTNTPSLTQPSIGTSTNRKTVQGIQKLDETAIPPTSALVKLFENNGVQDGTTASSPIQSPRPVRRSGLLEQNPKLQLLPPLVTKDKGNEPVEDNLLSSPESFRSARDVMSPTKTSPSKPRAPPPRYLAVERPTIALPNSEAHRKDSKIDVLHTAPISIARPRTRPTPSPSPSFNSSRSIAAAYHQLHPRRVTSLTTGEALANAIVASNLASSRAPSPTKLPPLPLRPAKPHHSLFTTRTPSPAKRPGLRQTMRKASTTDSSDEDDDPYSKHKKKRHIHRHPNKHHEGDRKRWRNVVTERERKRYEGVWAANKGLHVVATAAEQDTLTFGIADGKATAQLRESMGDQVAGVVVRDIWSRSRMPEQVLEQVWDLVDTQAVGRLTRQEFVLGLWLIDQRLKGRKLPVKVTDSVWNSVRFLQGIKIRK